MHPCQISACFEELSKIAESEKKSSATSGPSKKDVRVSSKLLKSLREYNPGVSDKDLLALELQIRNNPGLRWIAEDHGDLPAKTASDMQEEAEPNLSFIERHPKKILGAGAAGLAGLALYLNKDKLKNIIPKKQVGFTHSLGKAESFKDYLDLAGVGPRSRKKLLPEITSIDSHLVDALKSKSVSELPKGGLYDLPKARPGRRPLNPDILTFHKPK